MKKNIPPAPNALNLEVLRLFTDTLGLELSDLAVHEHTTVCYNNSQFDIVHWEALGFNKVAESGNTIFLDSGGRIRIELIPQNIPQHQGWAFESRETWDRAHRKLLSDDGIFAHIHELLKMNDEMCASMFKYMPTGAYLQIVWRKTPIFDGVFRK